MIWIIFGVGLSVTPLLLLIFTVYICRQLGQLRQQQQAHALWIRDQQLTLVHLLERHQHAEAILSTLTDVARAQIDQLHRQMLTEATWPERFH